MAEISINDSTLTVRLTPSEKLWCLRGDLHIPRSLVRRTRAVDDPFREIRGIRAPGLGLPGVVAIGRWRHRRGRDLVVLRRGERAVVIDLDDTAPFRRLLIGTADPDHITAQMS